MIQRGWLERDPGPIIGELRPACGDGLGWR
jgi:hypothetical protein